MSADSLRTVRNLTQNAFLEGFLTRYRTGKIVPYVRPGNVLDFGCGSHFYTLKALQGIFKNAIGLDQLFLGRPPVKHPEGFYSVGSLDDVAGFDFRIDQVVALACFEHFYESELREVLLHIHGIRVLTRRSSAQSRHRAPNRCWSSSVTSCASSTPRRSRITSITTTFARLEISQAAQAGGWMSTGRSSWG